MSPPRLIAEPVELWRPLAERGNADAQNRLGVAYELGKGVPQDYATAVSWYRKAADQGDAKVSRRPCLSHPPLMSALLERR
jgi:uncharacterized protein